MSSQISQFIWHSYGGPIPSTSKTTTEIQVERGASITLEIDPERRASLVEVYERLRSYPPETMGHHLHLPMGHHLHLPIGNTACTHNAESPHLRCAVNPCGPCEGCPEFEAKP